jgi:multiple sugar transport system substrate-binding protein
MTLGRRQFLQLSGLAALAAAALPACGSAILAEPDVSAAGFGQNASGTVTMWCRGATAAGVQVAIQRFHASQQRLHVDLTPVPDAQYVTKLATAIRGRRVPDLVDIDDINAMLFIYRDTFTDLTPLVDALPFRQAISPGHLHLATRNSRIYGVPYLADNSVLWYDKQLLDKAGVDPATAVRSFDALLDAARRVRALGPDIYGWSIAGNSPGILGFVVQPHIWATGTDQITGELGSQRGHIEGNEPLRQTLQLYRGLWSDGVLARSAFADTGTTWGSDFQAGKVGFFPSNYAAAVLTANNAARQRMGVTLLPGPTGGGAFFDGGDNMCIPRGAKNPSGAWEFARFALDLAQQQQLPTGGYTPVRSDAATPAFRRQFPLDTVQLDNLQRGYAPLTLSYNLLFNQPDSPFTSLFRRAVFSGDIDGALRSGQTGFDTVLKQAQL